MLGVKTGKKEQRKACLLIYNPIFFIFKVGVTTEELDSALHHSIISYGAYPSPLNYKGFPKSVCTSVNNVAVHGIPDRYSIWEEEILYIKSLNNRLTFGSKL
jgi:methionyl aminopeptidase